MGEEKNNKFSIWNIMKAIFVILGMFAVLYAGIKFIDDRILIGISGLILVVLIYFATKQNGDRKERDGKIQKIVEGYIQNTVRYPGEGWDFLIKDGVLKLDNKGIQRVCREVEERGYEHPFTSFPDVKKKKIFKKTLQTYLDRKN